MMKLILLSLILQNQVQFTYEPYDGSAALSCKHTVANSSNPYDLTVSCSDQKGTLKQFNVHLSLSKYTHPTPPLASYELLYWVNDNGATTWFHFDQDTGLKKLESSQSIAGDVAGLKLTLTL